MHSKDDAPKSRGQTYGGTRMEGKSKSKSKKILFIVGTL